MIASFSSIRLGFKIWILSFWQGCGEGVTTAKASGIEEQLINLIADAIALEEKEKKQKKLFQWEQMKYVLRLLVIHSLEI